MSEDDYAMTEGKYYLFYCPWDWSYVGRFVAIRGPHVVIDHAIHFIRTGRPTGELIHLGLVKSGDGKSLYTALGNGHRIGPFAETKIHPWHAATDWPNPDEGGGNRGR